MSEKITSKTAEGVEAQQPSLMEKMRGSLVNPVGKATLVLSMVAGVSTATFTKVQKALGDTVVCVTFPNNSIVIDRIGEPFKNGEATTPEYSSSYIDSLEDIIYQPTGDVLSTYGRNLEPQSDVNRPNGIGSRHFIEGSDIMMAVEGGNTRFLKIESNSLVQKGFVEKPGSMSSMVSDGENIFMITTGFTGTGEKIPTEIWISGITTQSINDYQGTDPIEPSIEIKIDDCITGTGGKPFVDEVAGEVLVPYQNSVSNYGYAVTVDGVYQNFITVNTNGKIIQRGCVDEVTGDRYLLTKTDQNGKAELIILDSDGAELARRDVYPLYIDAEDSDPMKSLPSGGVGIVEKGKKLITTIKYEGGQIILRADKPDGLPITDVLNECAVLTDLCEGKTIDDGDDCTDESCDPVTGVITTTPAAGCEDTGIPGDVIDPEDTTDVTDQDVVEPSDDIPSTDDGVDTTIDTDTGTDSQEEDVTSDVTTSDTSNDEGRDDTVQTDTATPDTGVDGSTDPGDVIDNDTTVEEGNKPGGCSSVPGGVADTRGAVTLLLAGLAALGIKRRRDAVKSKE